MRRYMLYVGIDPGVKTGLAVYDSSEKKLTTITTVGIIEAMDILIWFKHSHEFMMFVRLEDARQRKWFGNAGREKLQGAGSIKRDCQIWEEFLKSRTIPFELVAPKNNKTKWSAAAFKQATKWDGHSSEHSRDAAMLVYGF